MRCVDEKKIQQYVDKRVEPREFGEITTHLASCQGCQGKVKEYGRVSYLVKRAAPVYEEIEELEKTILTKIEQLRHRPQWMAEPEPVALLSWLKPWAVQVAALGIAAVLLGGWLGLLIGTPSPRPGRFFLEPMNGSLVQILSQRSERSNEATSYGALRFRSG